MVIACHIVHAHTKSYSEAEGQRENEDEGGIYLDLDDL